MHEGTAPASDDPLALERQLCFGLAATSRQVVGLYRPVLEPLGLTHPQYLVMLALWERSPRNLREIADAVSVEPPTLTPLVRRLEGLGYVVRERNPADERELRIDLTDAGSAMRAQALLVPERIAARLGLAPGFSEDLLRLLGALRDAVASTASAERGSHREAAQAPT